MKPAELSSVEVARLAARLPAARADGTVGDGAARIEALTLGAFVHVDRADVDDVEHMRHHRLKRWQKPPIPTRKAQVSR